MNTVGLLAYGETAPYALKGLVKKYSIPWIITPSQTEETSLLVEKLATEYKIPIHRTNTNKQIQELVEKTSPDAVVISSYNKILPKEILSTTRFINVHHGDLPRFRGRANSNWAIILGREEIGLTFHEAIPDLDAGRIYAQYIVPIEKIDTVRSVYEKFNRIIEEELGMIVNKVLDGYEGEEQKGKPTYCCTRLPEDGFIDWNKTSVEIYNLIRALTQPFPGAFTFYQGKKLYVWEAELPKDPKNYEGRIPGRVIDLHNNTGVEVLTSDSSIIIKLVSHEDQKSVTADKIIKTVKTSLGLNILDLYKQVIALSEK